MFKFLGGVEFQTVSMKQPKLIYKLYFLKINKVSKYFWINNDPYFTENHLSNFLEDEPWICIQYLIEKSFAQVPIIFLIIKKKNNFYLVS